MKNLLILYFILGLFHNICSQDAADCQQLNYRGNNIQQFQNIFTLRDCDDLCLAVDDCSHFSWTSDDSQDNAYTCHLKNIIGTPQVSHVSGIISGPQSCSYYLVESSSTKTKNDKPSGRSLMNSGRSLFQNIGMMLLGGVVSQYFMKYEKPVCPSLPMPELNMTSSVLEPLIKLEPYFPYETPYIEVNTTGVLPNMFDGATPAKESEFVYDLLNSRPLTDTSAGFTQIVRSSMWPRLKGSGIAIARFNNPPCVVGIPHYHLYSNEIGYITRGSNITFGIKEPGKPLEMVKGLKAGQLAIFPQGSIHFTINLNCEEEGEALLIHTDERTDTLPVGGAAMELPEEILATAFNTEVGNIQALKAAKTFEWELLRFSHDCLQRCGLGPIPS